MLEARLAGIETKLALLLWMAALHLAMSVAGLWLLVRVASKVGALG